MWHAWPPAAELQLPNIPVFRAEGSLCWPLTDCWYHSPVVPTHHSCTSGFLFSFDGKLSSSPWCFYHGNRGKYRGFVELQTHHDFTSTVVNNQSFLSFVKRPGMGKNAFSITQPGSFTWSWKWSLFHLDGFSCPVGTKAFFYSLIILLRNGWMSVP